MIPIYEQGHGQGIGYGIDGFMSRFDDICKEHVAEGRAQAFAFIFYDFNDHALRSILRNQGVFAKIDRISGKELSVFYLHNGTQDLVDRFNRKFLAMLGITEKTELPCVVFFKFKNDQIGDIKAVQLDNADIINGFGELFTAIERYLTGNSEQTAQPRALKWLKASSKLISVEVFRAALRRGLDFYI